MGVKYGTNNPAKFYYGSSSVQKLYLGSTLIWSNDGSSPFSIDAVADKYWNFNGSYSADTVNSPTLDHYHTSFDTGLINQSLVFDGTSSLNAAYGMFQNSASTWTSDYTVTWWYKFDTVPTSPRLMFSNDPGFGGTFARPFNCQFSDTSIVLVSGQPGTNATLTIPYTPDTNWHLIAFQYRVSSPRVGISIDAGPFTYQDLTDPVVDGAGGSFAWGGVYGGSQPGLIGRIDMLGIFPRLLTSGNITYLYNGGAGREVPF